MTWADEARARIASLMAAMPADATLQDRRLTLRRNAHVFHEGTSWGKKIWSREARKYLERLGLPPLQTPTVESHPSFSADIVFPFRSPSQ